ncbi:MAG: methyltransferase domain-containing protein, partial [Planctomycetes bacterium]|nr:methyltransferase domain-containing protein [Planctomycetota bacterium]
SQVLDRSYDFVTCTETAEHFFEPGKEFEKLNGLVQPGGWLAVMTELFRDQVFVDWRYVRDETHVAFYRQRTMQWNAEWLDWSVSFPGKDVVIFRKPIQ